MGSDKSKHREVVIVGAGPVGLALALALARQGRGVLVLEKNESTSAHSRAPAIWPATQEILAELGVIDAFLSEGIVLPRIEIHDVDRNMTLFTAPMQELSGITSFPHLLVLPQSRTEALLLKAVREQPSAEVQFSCEAINVTQGDDGVTVNYRSARDNKVATVVSSVAVGCDGARSTVRERIGARLKGETYAVEAALADVEVKGSDELPFPRLTTQPSIAIGIRMRKDLWRLILPFSAREAAPLEQRVELAVAELLHRPYTTVWQSDFKLHRRLSSTFSDGFIALAGDAAHLNSPVGGQGMNAGIKDAWLLSPAVTAALDGHTHEPISEYARARRMAVRKGVNRFTNRLTRTLLWRQGRMIRSVFAAAQTAMRIAPVRRRVLKRMAMLD